MSSPQPRTAPYGSWTSPVSAAALTADTVALAEPRLDGADCYWLEGRPADQGRVVVVRRTAAGVVEDVTSAPFNVRSRVHEYGGGAYDVLDGVLVFCDFADRRVYRVDLAADGSFTEPRPITPAGSLRYGDLQLVAGTSTAVAVCEDHSTDEVSNRLVRIDVAGDNSDGGTVLASGHDFYSAPRLSPDGRRIAWIQWDHPNMPWDGTELCVAELADAGCPTGSRVLAGGPRESVTQPRWTADGSLVFICDRTGWWNLYARDVSDPDAADEPRWAAAHEFADPGWMLGMSSYGISDSDLLVCRWLDRGYVRLGTVDLRTGERAEIDLDGSGVTAIMAVVVAAATAVLLVGYDDRPNALVLVDLASRRIVEVLRASAPGVPDPGQVSRAEPVSWLADDGDEVHGFFNAPVNPGFRGPEGDLPPLIVMSHGGPTGMSPPVYDPRLQFWTTRGIAVLTVNYRGSSGYGRAYRDRLQGSWGVVDVDDCASGALAMASSGRADAGRLAIRGGSAGGYTTLAALTFRDVFTAGASHFGIGDLETLARDTHKFESRYLDGLVGPYPERADLYRERSPIHHVDQLRCPLILLQGRDDLVVPLNQAEDMAAAVRAQGLPVALVVFDGEGHGFRRADTIVASMEAELYFYSRVFGFDLGNPVPGIAIENL